MNANGAVRGPWQVLVLVSAMSCGVGAIDLPCTDFPDTACVWRRDPYNEQTVDVLVLEADASHLRLSYVGPDGELYRETWAREGARPDLGACE